jgi:nicotinamidase/pyrazinamidase
MRWTMPLLPLWMAFRKPTFGAVALVDALRALHEPPEEIEFVGVCTGICVISNAMLCKAAFPEANIVIDAALCACVTPESHDTALNAMRLCQMEILHQGEEPWRK